MKRLFFLVLGVMLLASTLFAWQQSVQNSWNGSIWVDGSTNFTPPTTSVQVKMTAPTVAVDCTEEPVLFCDRYYTTAQLVQGITTITASRQNGGCVKTNGTVNTTSQATLTAKITEDCSIIACSGNQRQAWGPVTAAAGDALSNCNQN